VGGEVDNQVAAPTETSTPNLHRAKIAHQECGWKDGDRGGSAKEGKKLIQVKIKPKQKKEKTHSRKIKTKTVLDTNRPSHGRT
jgi:hypothetical protein